MITKLIRKLIPNKLKSDLKMRLGVPCQKASFLRLKELGFSPVNILDVGAYEGRCASEIKSIFQGANIMMIEGQEAKESILLEKSKSIENSSVVIALLGANTKFEKVYLIKLDTQGYELEILKGATKTLQYAQIVLMEVSLLEIYKGAPLAHEVITYMNNKGFILYDICSIMRRPFDKALFQTDFLFIKKGHSLISSTR